MGDSEIKEDVVNKEINADKADSEKSVKEKSAKKKSGFFRSLKAEFKKVVWPNKETIIKETTAVVVVTVILGAIIALLDFVIKTGLDKIIQIG